MKKAVRLLLILLLALTVNGCDVWDDIFDDDDDNEEVTLAVEETAAPQASTGTASAQTASTSAATSGSEHASYFGTTNGGLPTWYFSKSMGSYPKPMTINLPGCGSATVMDNHRWVGFGCVLKQSEVPSRGMGLICTGCVPKGPYVTW